MDGNLNDTEYNTHMGPLKQIWVMLFKVSATKFMKIIFKTLHQKLVINEQKDKICSRIDVCSTSSGVFLYGFGKA